MRATFLMKTPILVVMVFCALAVQAEVRLRPADWAVPVIGSKLGNFYALDNKVYRSEQPDSQAFGELKAFGIKEVLNLRQYHSDDDEAENLQIKLHHIKMNAGYIRPEQLVQALRVIQKSKGPILIHCWHGSDRTGTVSAAYRIVFQGWTKEQAIQELKEGGYGYHARFYPNIIDTLQTLDVDSMRKALGLLDLATGHSSH